MDFFEQLKRTDLLQVEYPFLKRASGLSDRLLAGYLRLFSHRLKPMKPVAMANGMPVYDLTQPPMYSQPGSRILRDGFEHVVRKRPPKPITMVLMVNSACDMKCAHCSARDYIHSGRKSLSYDEILSVVDQFLEMGGSSLVLSGGEPTLHPRLADVVAHVPKDMAVVSMFSNGSRLAERADELQAAGLFGTLVSLDSDEPAVHDRLRGLDGGWERAANAIRTLQSKNMLVGISTYVTRPGHHAQHFQRMVNLATAMNVPQLFAFDAVPTGALLSDQDWILTPQDREGLKELIKQQNASPDGPAIMGQSWVNSPEGFGCFAGFYQLYINAAGDVAPCDFTPITFGNVREEPLQVIWNRMRASQEWGIRHMECRMQDVCFRRSTVDLVPPGTRWPITYQQLEEFRRQALETSPQKDS